MISSGIFFFASIFFGQDLCDQNETAMKRNRCLLVSWINDNFVNLTKMSQECDNLPVLFTEIVLILTHFLVCWKTKCYTIFPPSKKSMYTSAQICSNLLGLGSRLPLLRSRPQGQTSTRCRREKAKVHPRWDSQWRTECSTLVKQLMVAFDSLEDLFWKELHRSPGPKVSRDLWPALLTAIFSIAKERYPKG